MLRCSTTWLDAAVASCSPATPTNAASSAALFSLYRRLLKSGESPQMLRRCIDAHPLAESLQYGLQLLRLQRALTEVDSQARETSTWRVLRRMRLAGQRRYHAWRLTHLRLKLHCRATLLDVLVYVLFLVVCVLLYEIVHTCRVGVRRAEDRYRTLAIPVIQTFEALEAAQERKRRLHGELEDDIKRER